MHRQTPQHLLLPGRMVRSFATSWLAGEERARAFLDDGVVRPEARADAVRAAATRAVDPRLLAVLARQNARLPVSPQRDRHLTMLAQPGTVVVVTGQQVGLFLGPLLTLYKAMSAIAAARQLTAETGVPCVPLFWLQTEDHDFAEIDHCFVPEPGQPPRRVALAPTPPSRVPVAHRVLGPSATDAVADLGARLAQWPHAAEVMALISAAYVPQNSPARAFALALAQIFADEGLILLDPRDAEVASLAAPLHRRLLVEAGAIAESLQGRAESLRRAGFAPQVHIRPGSPLAFIAPDAEEGDRYRLDPAGSPDRWQLVGHPEAATVAGGQLLAWLEVAPARFSTSALARPLLQDSLLPTAAYVGGPGELSYFAQLAPLYRHLALPMPLFVHRARLTLCEARTRPFLASLGLTVGDVRLPPSELAGRAAAAGTAGFAAPGELLGRLRAGLDLAPLEAELVRLDPNLGKAVQRTGLAVDEALQRLVDKYANALGQRDRTQWQRLERLQTWLWPGHEPQERVYGLPGPAARFGLAPLLAAVRAAVQPFAADAREVDL